MANAYIGILETDNTFNYVKITENSEPYKAYPLLNTHYRSYTQAIDLVNYYQPIETVTLKSNKISDMRYDIKHKLAIICYHSSISYIYVYHKRMEQWYCYDLNNNGWISLTKLKTYQSISIN